jgi:hypothetical protein
MSDVLHCPKCNCEIEIAGALAAQVRSELQKQFDAETRLKNKELAEREELLNHQEEKLILGQAELDKELKRRVEAAFAEREETLGQRDKELLIRQKKLDEEVSQRLERERSALEAAAAEKAKKTAAVEVGDLTSQLTETQTKLQEAQKAELTLRKERRDLEQQKKELELEVARTLDAERHSIQEKATKAAAEAAALKEAEKDKLINDLRSQIGDLQRKSEQGSQQAQGEVLEEELEKRLAQQFPGDQICPVPKGVHGGDIVHRVINPVGRECGVILWETKRTKRWSDDWLPKLRNDQRTAKAQVAILVSIELPKDVANFAQRDGVWISNRNSAFGLATALRAGLMEVAKTLASLEGRQEKMDLLYNYLSSVEFRNRVEGIVEAFKTMREDLESEKRAMQKHWARREKQLDLAVKNTGGLHGDLSGIMGHSLQAIEMLALPGGDTNEG